ERIGDKNALPALRDKLIDRSPLVRGYAAVTVARLGGSDEIRTLRESFNKERHAFSRACLFGALYSLGNLAVLKNLRAISATKNPKHYDLLRHARNASHSSQRA